MRRLLIAPLFAIAISVAPPALAQDASADYTQPHQRKALDIYRTLIGFRTAAGHGQVPKAVEYLAGQFREGGFPASDVHVLPFTSETGEAIAGLVVWSTS